MIRLEHNANFHSQLSAAYGRLLRETLYLIFMKLKLTRRQSAPQDDQIEQETDWQSRWTRVLKA